MENLIKIGYMRVVGEQGSSYISYKEFLSFDEQLVSIYLKRYQARQIRFFCACSPNNDLELTLTENGIMRVKNNKQQELHKKSCPKSIYYPVWNNHLKKGNFLIDADGEIIFKITMPAVIKSLGSSGKSSGNSSSEPKAHTSLLAMITTLNALAWEKQTFSIKKKIVLAKREGISPEWKYKTSDEFIRLIFGISNDITVQTGQHSFQKFIDLCYRKDTYFANSDYRRRFFIYAEIIKVTEVNESRKYQYVTLKMPSDKYNKTTVRIKTDIFLELFATCPEDPAAKRILSGYVHRSLYQESDWMTFLKGFAVYTSLNGLYAENIYVASVINFLSEKKLIFKRIYQPIESYGENIPTLLIERLYQKDILLDFVSTKQTRKKRLAYADNNEEYIIYTLLYEELSPAQVYDLIMGLSTHPLCSMD